MQLASLLNLNAAVEGGKAGGCRYNLDRLCQPKILAAPLWGRLSGQRARVRSEGSGLRLQDGLVQRKGDFGRSREEALSGMSSRRRAVARSVRDWMVLLVVGGCAFTGLGLAGMAGIERRRAAYERGKVIWAEERREAGLRRVCLVTREANSRTDRKAVVAAVRWPLQRLEAPAWPAVERDMLAARSTRPGLDAPGFGAGPRFFLIGRQPGPEKPVQTAKSGRIATLEPRG
ncbi:MAG: hypothetical protein ACLQVX_15620 [Limisphaerales bacterium]